MANIIFEQKGPNYQVPGLPYEKTFQFGRSIVYDDLPTREDMVDLLASASPDTLTNPWSLQILKGFKNYIPTTFKRITAGMSPELLEESFNISGDWIPEHDRVLLQLQTEIEAKGATIDAAIIHNRKELGTVVNKAHILNRLYIIGRLYGHLQEREYPFLFKDSTGQDLTDPSHWDDALSDMKMQFIEYITEVPMGNRQYPMRIRKVDVSKKDLAEKYVYIEWLKDKLGDNLEGVLLYGSAARTDNPALYSDFDNWVLVKDVRAAHKILRNTCPSVYEGKVISCPHQSESIPGVKHLGLNIFPSSQDYFLRHVRFEHDSREFLKHTKVIYGEFPFQKISQDEVIERGLSQAYMKLKTIAGSLNWAYSTPENILGKPSLFEFIVKNVRFFLQHTLNALEEPKFRDKKELNERLTERGLYIPEYKPDLEHIQASLIYAMSSVQTLQKELVATKRPPNLDFLADGKKYEWHSQEIDAF